jgi:GntR family transcriptional regulator, transcriptional repressor for pyruvate dehydrogenase complex
MITSPPSEAAKRVRQYIVRQGLKPGDQLPTHEQLSRRLKLGRLRLREGLSILRHQGIIETRNRGGTIVCQPSCEAMGEPITWHLDGIGYDFEDLVTARACLESGAAAEAAKKRTARDLLVILDALERLEAAADSPQGDVAEEEAFHLAVMQATHNPVIITFSQLVQIQFQNKTLSTDTPDERRAANREHRRIYEEIERRNHTAARDAMYDHIVGQLKVRKP